MKKGKDSLKKLKLKLKSEEPPCFQSHWVWFKSWIIIYFLKVSKSYYKIYNFMNSLYLNKFFFNSNCQLKIVSYSKAWNLLIIPILGMVKSVHFHFLFLWFELEPSLYSSSLNRDWKKIFQDLFTNRPCMKNISTNQEFVFSQFSQFTKSILTLLLQRGGV